MKMLWLVLGCAVLVAGPAPATNASPTHPRAF
jgi:hypothetical protein